MAGAIGVVVSSANLAIRVGAVEYGRFPLALRDTERLGKLDIGRLRNSDEFPSETLCFALGMVGMP